MKPLYLILIFITLAITMVAIIVYIQLSPTKITSVTETITHTYVPANIEEDTIRYPDTSSPLTPTSLQARPGWNPTMEVEGMKRVEDKNSDLEVKNLPVHTEEIKSYSSSTFVIKYLEPEVSVEACEKYGLTEEPSGYFSYICPIATPDLFNEVIITSKDTGEVLHKYRLEDGYSFLNSKYQSEGPIMLVNPVYNKPYFLVVYIYKWGGIKERNSVESLKYYIDLITGEITEIKRENN